MRATQAAAELIDAQQNVLADSSCTSRSARSWHGLATSDDGMMTFVNVFTVGFLVLLIGFVGNTGRSIQEKLAVQSAADAAAYSSSVVMARAMNAVTATNHLMGEATSLIVVLDALGVPGPNDSAESSSQEVKEIRVEIELLLKLAPCEIAPSLDQRLLEKAKENIDKRNVPSQGGVSYDSILMLRKRFIDMLELKIIGNLILKAKSIPIVNAIAIPTGIAIHVAANVVILEMIKEAYILNFADQKLLPSPVLKELRRGLQSIIIPALSAYSDTIVGGSSNSSSVVLREAISGAVSAMKESHNLDDAFIYPKPEELHLPVILERPPQYKSQPQASRDKDSDNVVIERSRSLWTGEDKPKGAGAAVWNELENIRNDIARFLDPVDDFIANANRWTLGAGGVAVGPAKKLVHDVRSRLKPASLPRNSEIGGVGFKSNPSIKRLHEIPWQLERHSQWVRSTYPAVDSMRSPFRNLFKEHMPLSSASTFLMHWTNRFTLEDSWMIRGGSGGSQLPRLSREEIDKLRQLLADLQHKVQQLRRQFESDINGPAALAADATIPGDAYRATSQKLYEHVSEAKKVIDGLLHKLPFGEELRNWMNRVLNLEQELGEASKALAGSDMELDFFEADAVAMVDDLGRVELLGELLQRLDDLLRQLDEFVDFASIGPPHMYVMADSVPEQKGLELWTGSSKLAEKRFTILSIAHRKPQRALFGAHLFGIGSEKGITATAQAMFYNANGRRIPENRNPNSPTQPDTGWDTLNWMPPVEAPEWGDTSPASPKGSVLDLFQSSHRPDRPSQIQLNWQARLTPVTQTRMKAAREKSPWSELLGRDAGSSSSDRDLIRH